MKKKLSKAKRGKNIAKDRSSMEEAPCVNAYSLFVAIDPLHIQHQNKFSLLELDAINKLESRLAAFNQSSGFSDVFESVRARMGIVQELSDTALKVLNGDHHAKQKLKLLAESGLVKQSDWNPSWDRAISLSGAKGSPRLVNAEALIKIAVAAELGCDDRSDPDATQTGLKRLLEPFAVLDAIARVLDETWGEKRASTLDLIATALRPRDYIGTLEKSDTDLVLKKTAKSEEIFEIEKHAGPWKMEFPCLESEKKIVSMLEDDLLGPNLGPEFSGSRRRNLYNLQSVSNQVACPGETITLKGSNFGADGRVKFPVAQTYPELGSSEPPKPDDADLGVPAKRWTNAEIDVVVPPWAGPGDLTLASFYRRESNCVTYEVHRTGNSIPFEGGVAEVFDVQINGRPALSSAGPNNYKPLDVITLSWRVRKGADVTVDVELNNNGIILQKIRKTGGGFSEAKVVLPDKQTISRPTKVHFYFRVTSKCGGVREPLVVPIMISYPPELWIDWVEITQGVQTVQDGRSGELPVETVAYKDTAVRVHFKARRENSWYRSSVWGISGALHIDGRVLRPHNAVDIVSERGETTASSHDEVAASTLNFTIPAAWLTPGVHSVRVMVSCPDPAGTIRLSKNFVWGWRHNGPLRVRCLWLSYEGTFANTNFSGVINYARSVVDFLPFELSDIGMTSQASLVLDPDEYDMSTREGFYDLIEDIRCLRDDAGESDNVVWLAIYGPDVKTSDLLGLGGNKVAIAPYDDPEVGAHELGHALGLGHVKLWREGGPFPEPPYYEADNGGLLRRCSWDVRAKEVVDLPIGDLMSYFRPLPTPEFPRRFHIRPGITTWQKLFRLTLAPLKA